MLGAGGWQMFFRVTLPNVKWGLLYGMVLCNARAMGEFGAVSVVSGHIRGHTNTMPLYVEILYNDYQFAAAFAVASLLTAARHRDADRQVYLERRVDCREAWTAEDIASQSRGMSIELRNISKRFGDFVALDNINLHGRDRRAGRAAGPVGLGQDHAAADHRGAGDARHRRGAVPWRGRERRQRAQAQGRLRVSALRALSPHDGVREHRLRSARAAAARASRRDEVARRVQNC